MTKAEAMRLREIIETASQSLEDATSLRAICLYPSWAEGKDYSVGYKVRYNSKLYKVLQAHTSQADWTPEAAAALWVEICEAHGGTLEDPIPYSGNMTLEIGKYYTQDGIIYRCIRDTVNPVYNALSELVGLYVEAVSGLQKG